MITKTTIAIAIFTVICFESCLKKNDVNRRIVEDHFKYMNQHNLAAIKSQYADSASLYSYVMPGNKRGPLGADEIFHFQFFQSPNEQYKVVDIIDSDTATVVQYDVRGYLSLSIMRSGYGFRNCSVFKIRNGKIIDEVDYTGRQANEMNH